MEASSPVGCSLNCNADVEQGASTQHSPTIGPSPVAPVGTVSPEKTRVLKCEFISLALCSEVRCVTTQIYFPRTA